MGLLKYVGDKLFSNDKEVALVEDNGGIENGHIVGKGNWTKFPDGTMIQSFYSIKTPKGYLVSIEFPIPFVVSPAVSISIIAQTSNYYRDPVLSVESRTGIAFRKFDRDGNVVTDQYYVTYTAIGRWK